jgi:DNA-binding MarR family transcriptional regulator/GNAT superfamily N-acetyltransferase
MSATLSGVVQHVRAVSRSLVRELGFMNRHIAGTDLTPSQVHALIELDLHPLLQAAALKELLRLDKSATSRLVADLVERGYLRATTGKADGRAKPLTLTAGGRAVVKQIHRTANKQVITALEKLTASQRGVVANGLQLYAGALHASRSGAAPFQPSGVSIASGYAPGVIGEVVAMHGRYYAKHAGFGAFFEKQVAAELAEFFSRFDPASDGFWAARRADALLGSIAIEASRRKSDGARLRWFIVDESCQGLGLGGRLLEAALAHCDGSKYKRIYLTTFAGLDAARHLYEKHEFVLKKEARDSHWGKKEVEQLFVRAMPQKK